MKNNIYTLIAILFTIVSCTEEFDLEDRELKVELLPGYVAFNPDGANINFPDEETDEEGGEVELNIEIPTGNLLDITVTYSLSGSAVFGTDFNIEGASASGGQITIEHKQSTDPDDAEPDNVDIVVEILTDDVADGDKTLTITLESASTSEGNIAVGRGGTNLLRSANIIISDVD